jgi:outer membrane protein assembly factor BamD
MGILMRHQKTCLAILIVLLLSGCGGWTDFWKKKDLAKATPEALYQTGYQDYQEGNYKKAIESFQRLKEVYPLSPLTILAELGIADARYTEKEYGEAEIAYTDFYNLHPTNENVPYVLYQIGMCHYNQIASIDQDQTATLRAKKEFERLLTRFPTSKFSFMAEKKLKECRQFLAEREFYIGEFYFHMKQYKAALKRFEGLAKDYANLGLDFKVDYYMKETKKRLAEEEAKKKTIGDKGEGKDKK